MNLLNDTLNEFKEQGATHTEISEAKAGALKLAFERLDEESQHEVCEMIKGAMQMHWDHQEEMNAQNRAAMGNI